MKLQATAQARQQAGTPGLASARCAGLGPLAPRWPREVPASPGDSRNSPELLDSRNPTFVSAGERRTAKPIRAFSQSATRLALAHLIGMSLPAEALRGAQSVIDALKKDGQLVHDPSLIFLKEYLISLGAKLPEPVKKSAASVDGEDFSDLNDDGVVRSRALHAVLASPERLQEFKAALQRDGSLMYLPGFATNNLLFCSTADVARALSIPPCLRPQYICRILSDLVRAP